MARPPSPVKSAQPYVPGKAVTAKYGTPNLQDRLLKVRKDSRLADYEVPEKGATYKGPNAHKFRSFKFATLVPAPDQAEWFDWYYINERANQNAYNYKIEFPGGDKNKPKITRTYLFLREGYQEIADNSIDPVYGAGKILVDRIVTRSDDPVEDALFIMVSRVYETLPGVPLVERQIGQASLIPEKYRRLVTDITTKQPVEASYTFPAALTGNQTAVTLAQETITKARLEIVEEVINSGDALYGNDLDKWGTLRIYEEIVDEGDPIDTGYLILKSTVTPLGNGKSIKITIKYPRDLASTHEFTKMLGQANLIPEKYRRLVHHIENDSLVGVDYTFPTGLTGNQASVEYVQENLARARLKITEEVIDVDLDPLLGKELDAWGTLRIYESIVDDGANIDTGYLILKSTVTPLGNGKSVKITVKYPDALASEILRQKSLGQSNLIPEKYRGLVKHFETNSFVNPGTYTFPSSLSGDQTEIEYIEEQMDRARLKITEEIIGAGSALAGKEWDKWGTLVITEAIVNDGTAVDTDYFVLKSTVTPLGNGKSIKITVKYPSNLASQIRAELQLGKSSLIPEKYRGLVQQSAINKFVDPNTYTFPTALTGDQTSVEYIQETLNRARLKIVAEVIGTGSALSGKEHDKWGRLTIDESIVNDGTAEDATYLTLKSSVTPLGNGKSVKITVNYPADLASTVQHGQEYDKNLDLVTPYIDTLQPSLTGIGQPRTIVEAQTLERELNRTPDVTALEEIFETYLLAFPGTANIQLPDVLDSITAFTEARSGEGFFSETGSAFWFGSGSASLDIRGSGNSSASIMPIVNPEVSQAWGHNVPTKRFMFLVEMPFTWDQALIKMNALAGISANPWPKFKPVGVAIYCIGEALTLTTEATAKWMSGGSDSGSQGAVSTGSGSSRRLELTVNTVRVPPTLHDALYAIGDNIILETVDISCTADAYINDDIHAHIEESGTVTGRAYAGIEATSIPSLAGLSGDYLMDVKAEPYEYGWAMVHCEVVDAADFN